MQKIYLFKTHQNKVDWSYTRSMIIDNYPHYFSDGNADFGAGNEPFTTCPGCNRRLPMVLFHLDHIRSQNRYAVGNLGILGNDKFVIIDENCHGSGPDTKASAVGGTVTIKTGSIYAPKIGISHAAAVWSNDLRNLQFLCGHCNTSKQDKDWIDWGKSLNTAKPLSALWKHSFAQAMTN